MSALSPEAAAREIRSRQALVQRFPDLGPILSQGPAGRRVVEGGRQVDIAFNANRFYGCDGWSLAQQQVKDFITDPLRLQATIPTLKPADNFANRWARTMGELWSNLETEPATLPRYPLSDANSLLVVIGIGLGYHLPLLIEHLKTQTVILADTHPEFLCQSLSCIDWEDLMGRLASEGRNLILHLSDTPEILANALGRRFEEIGTVHLDGSYLYLHHTAPPLKETFQQVMRNAGLAYLTRGFVEDECTLLRNTTLNLNKHTFRLIDGSARRARPEFAAIVGSGPSLAADWDNLKRCRDRMIVFSSGTALRACLLNGIVPDYHVELENLNTLAECIDSAGAIHDLGDISLIAATSVASDVADRFKETFLFFRERSVASRVYAPQSDHFDLVGPMVANAAVRMAAALGFRSLCLFGVDCGSREPDRLHVDGTINSIDPQYIAYNQTRVLDVALPANFGGTVFSNTDFIWSKKMIERTIEVARLNVLNCSDGVLIRGAVPRRAITLESGGRPNDRAVVKSAIAKQLRFVSRGALNRPDMLDGLAQAVRTLAQSLADAATGSEDYATAADALCRTLASHNGTTAHSFFAGSVDVMMKLALPVLIRLDLDDPRRAAYQAALRQHTPDFLRTLEATALAEIARCRALLTSRA